jgi:hypothetical protein
LDWGTRISFHETTGFRAQIATGLANGVTLPQFLIWILSVTLSLAKMISGANTFRISVTSSIRANPQGQNATILPGLRQAK